MLVVYIINYNNYNVLKNAMDSIRNIIAYGLSFEFSIYINSRRVTLFYYEYTRILIERLRVNADYGRRTKMVFRRPIGGREDP